MSCVFFLDLFTSILIGIYEENICVPNIFGFICMHSVSSMCTVSQNSCKSEHRASDPLDFQFFLLINCIYQFVIVLSTFLVFMFGIFMHLWKIKFSAKHCSVVPYKALESALLFTLQWGLKSVSLPLWSIKQAESAATPPSQNLPSFPLVKEVRRNSPPQKYRSETKLLSIFFSVCVCATASRAAVNI